MPILIKNHVGKGFPLNVSTTLTEKLNADGSLEFEIIENDNNYDVISGIGKMWTVTKVAGDNDEREYRITMIDRSMRGKKQAVKIIAVQKEIDDLKIKRVYENYTGSFTAATYFDAIFNKTNYKYKLLVKTNALHWENAGDGDTVFEMFQKGLERYGLEYNFESKTNTFFLSSYFENKAPYYISSDLNANAIKIEEDASELRTYIRGYGNFEENDDFREAALQMEYIHPLADVVGIREADPIINQKITEEDTMKRYLESEINSSFKTSITLDFLVLKTIFPEAIAKIGDVIPIHSRELAIHEDARIIEVKTKRDINNKILKQDVLLGDVKRAERYQKKVNQAANMASGLGGDNSAIKTIRTITNKVNLANTVTTEVAKSSKSISYSEKGIKTSNNEGYVTFGEGKLTASADGNTFTDVINGTGVLSHALPLATEDNRGAINPEEKKKLNQIEYDSIKIVGNDKKKYILTVIDGKLTVKESTT
ncbi:DUF7643 domain-containing protein [Staphylococcus chromogenes]|uniref:tail tube TT1 domain-containing protein n=1 Tax=Staphylococcus chromogenes TaxID=46126 RepID=UPI000E691B02|nr:phage tail protein [Staphylococcus chromogenes]RIM19294.1 hypothetical protein BU660_10225 [Staphylococcus chromogenes]